MLKDSFVKKFIFIIGFLLSLNILAVPIRVVDGSDHIVELKSHAHRIITLAPNLTEIVFAAGAGTYLVGVSSMSDYPKAALKIPVISNYQEIDLEKVVMLKPDLIIAWQYTNALMIAQLKRLNYPIYIATFNQLSDIPKTIENIGKLSGTNKVAKKAANQFNEKLQWLKQKYARQKRATVFYQLSQAPLLTINQHALADQVIQLCGGQNIFENTVGLSPTVSIENILAVNPKIILVSDFAGNRNAIQFWKKYPMLQAVKNKRIYFINPSLVERPGPRMLQGMEEVCGSLLI